MRIWNALKLVSNYSKIILLLAYLILIILNQKTSKNANVIEGINGNDGLDFLLNFITFWLFSAFLTTFFIFNLKCITCEMIPKKPQRPINATFCSNENNITNDAKIFTSPKPRLCLCKTRDITIDITTKNAIIDME